jgi:hypothetical protein
VVILFQSVGLGWNDIAQIDEFIEHAQFHNEQYGDNLFIFISKHYGEHKAEHNQEHQEEKKEHEELPFQQQMPTNSLIASLLNSNKKELTKADLFEIKEYNFYYLMPSSSLHLEEFFQPPRQS